VSVYGYTGTLQVNGAGTDWAGPAVYLPAHFILCSAGSHIHRYTMSKQPVRYTGTL